jgi:hypothetical protein
MRSAAYRTRRYSSSIGKYREYLVSNNLFVNESFDYEFTVIPGGIRYRDRSKALFCRGFGMHANPYFKNLPLDGTKESYLLLRRQSSILTLL